jgi:hypothetical protein
VGPHQTITTAPSGATSGWHTQGARSYAAIAEWIGDAGAQQRMKLGLSKTDIPDLTTIWRLLIAVDPLQLDRAIGGWLGGLLRRRSREGRRRVVAIDGKSIRGARHRGSGEDDGQERAPHLMGCIDHSTGVVLAQVSVGSKTNEIPMFSVTLDQIEDLKDVLVTLMRCTPSVITPPTYVGVRRTI